MHGRDTGQTASGGCGGGKADRFDVKRAMLQRGPDVLIPNVLIADTFGKRMKGLLGASTLSRGEALYLVPCSAIHTAFMRFRLDVIFVSRELQVVRVVRDVGRFRMVWGGSGAHGVLEMEAGWFPADALTRGDSVKLRQKAIQGEKM